MIFCKNKKDKKEVHNKKENYDFILPLYLNQRFVYDILAITNGGFTEFFEVKDKKENSDIVKTSVNANFGNNNDFSLIRANLNTGAEASISNDVNNEKSYKKTHTPTSLFMQVYNYLKLNNKIKNLKNFEDIDNVTSGDFVELKSNVEFNTIVDFFETLEKVIDISEAFSSFATIDTKQKNVTNPFSKMKRPVENTISVLRNSSSKIKYGICKLDDKDIVVKLNTDYFINSDFTEIKNGSFKIIGKVLEIVDEDKEVLLNRENAVGLYDPAIFAEVKEAFNAIPKIKAQEMIDTVKGKTIVIMPIAIGI